MLNQSEEKPEGSLEAPDPVSFRTLNYPMVIYWHRIKHMPEAQKFPELFSQIFGELLYEDELSKFCILKYLLERKELNDFTKTKENILKPLNLSDEQMNNLWSNKINGIGSYAGLKNWYLLYSAKKTSEVRE
jgi:hypothetical protein